jgi:hypothetical protein
MRQAVIDRFDLGLWIAESCGILYMHRLIDLGFWIANARFHIDTDQSIDRSGFLIADVGFHIHQLIDRSIYLGF